MRHHLLITISILAMASLLLSVPSYSQDKDLLTKADSLHKKGLDLLFTIEMDEEGAILLFEKEAAIVKEQLGDYSAEFANSIFWIGICYKLLNDYAKALEYFQQVLAIDEKVSGKEHLNEASILIVIGDCYSSIGDYAKALQYYQRFIISLDKKSNKGNRFYCRGLVDLSICCRYIGDDVKALEYLQQAQTICETLVVKDGEYVEIMDLLGVCYSNLGDSAKALECLESALAVGEKVLGSDEFLIDSKNTPEYARCLNDIGVCYLILGDNAKALESFQNALTIFGGGEVMHYDYDYHNHELILLYKNKIVRGNIKNKDEQKNLEFY